DLVSALKHAAELVGHEPDSYGSHSLRSLGASARGLRQLGHHGRWRSDAVERYTRMSSQLTARMAGDM
ncbi:hypothetical protein PHYSODRAFT_373244, partial [Phytophthora sojae]